MTAAPAASLQTNEVALSANPYPVVIGEGGLQQQSRQRQRQRQ